MDDEIETIEKNHTYIGVGYTSYGTKDHRSKMGVLSKEEYTRHDGKV